MQDFMLTKTKKKRMGRPRIGTQNAKGKVFAVRLTPVEAGQVNAAIRRSKQGKSDWLRNALISASQSGTVGS